jgi:phosphatidylserine/phosphatidylglycerophosphate/cardiolipin synthase-like enzyme
LRPWHSLASGPRYVPTRSGPILSGGLIFYHEQFQVRLAMASQSWTLLSAETRPNVGRLTAISRAGIDVRIVAPAFSDVQAAVYAARASYGDLLEAGAHIYEMRDAVVHAKLAVVDDTWTVVGSSNLDRRSVVFNNEVDAVILGHDTAGQVEALIKQYMDVSRPIELDRWERRSLRERMRELEAGVWQYWM